MAHLFFSYAHNDYDRLLPVVQRMELITERMIWVDRIGLQRDAEWEAMIQRAIASSDGVIFAVTEAFVTRPFILDKEIPWAIERFNDSRQGKLLFPILFDDVPLPTALRKPDRNFIQRLVTSRNAPVGFVTHVLDARDGDYERVIQELKQVIPGARGEQVPFVVSWPRLRNFRGRDQQLVDLHAAMQHEDGKAGIKTAGMYGTGGIGKTQLAVEFCYRYRFYFPGGVYWLNAAQDWQGELADVADHLGLKPIDPDDTNRNKQMALGFKQYREQSGQEALLVLDNVENPADLSTREIAPKLTIPALCQATRTRLIITTRVQTLPEDFARVEVTKLDPADALDVLLDAWQGGQDTPPRTDPPDETALNAIGQLFDYLPLPLGWMAAALRQRPTLQATKLLDNLRQQSVDETIEQLKQGGVSLGTPEYYAALVGAGLDWQIRQVDNANALHLLTLIAAYGEASVIPAARLRLLANFGTNDLLDPFEGAVNVLKKYSLIELQQNGAAFRLHPLEHDHLRRKLPDYRTRLGEAADNLVGAYRTPDVLVRETLARGFDAVVTDLRETQPAIPADRPVQAALTELLRTFEWEAYYLRGQYPAGVSTHDGGGGLIQRLRERVHHQGTDQVLRDACDRWLEVHKLPHLRSLDAWRRPNDLALIRVFEGHTYNVSAVAFAPDGRTALSGSGSSIGTKDYTLRLWDVASGAQLRRFEGHSGAVTAVAFAPDSRTALSGSWDQTLRLWDVASGAELRRFKGHSSQVMAVAFAPDGRTVLSGSRDQTMRLWDVASGAELRRFEGKGGVVSAVAFAPDGRTALSGSFGHTLLLWDVASGAELRRFEGHSSQVMAVAFAPDGRTALSSSGGILRLWDVTSGAELRRFEGHSFGFAPDGRTVLSGSGDSKLRLWDVASGAELRRFEGHSEVVTAVAFAPDGRTALSGSDDWTLRLWDMTASAELRRFEGHSEGATALALAPDGRTALSGSRDHTLRLWDVASGVELHHFKGHSAQINALAFAPDGRTALSASGLSYHSVDATLRLWDVAGGVELRRFEGHSDSVTVVAFAPDGRMALSSSLDFTLRLWDVASGAELRHFQEYGSKVNAVAFAPDGRTALSGSDDNMLRLWDVTSGVELRRFEGHSGFVYAAVFAPDGRTVLSGSHDNTLRLWDVTSGAELRRFEGHSEAVTAVAFAPDGRMALSGSWDHTLRLWDVATAKLMAVLHLEAPLLSVVATNPPLVMVGDRIGGLWVLSLHVAP
jgi:WD40 repeat protein